MSTLCLLLSYGKLLSESPAIFFCSTINKKQVNFQNLPFLELALDMMDSATDRFEALDMPDSDLSSLDRAE